MTGTGSTATPDAEARVRPVLDIALACSPLAISSTSWPCSKSRPPTTPLDRTGPEHDKTHTQSLPHRLSALGQLFGSVTPAPKWYSSNTTRSQFTTLVCGRPGPAGLFAPSPAVESLDDRGRRPHGYALHRPPYLPSQPS